MSKLLTIQSPKSQQILTIESLDFQQLDQVLGGSVQKISGIHKVTDVTLKRGIVG